MSRRRTWSPDRHRQLGISYESAHMILASLKRAIVSRAPVERLFDEHRTGKADHRKGLWSLLVLELWRKEHPGARVIAERAHAG
jgi:hypothetical protein